MSGEPLEISLDKVRPNPEQPRHIFDADEMAQLAQSIKIHGVIQTITVEQIGDEYVLHDGERRTIAARMAGLTTIKAMIEKPASTTPPQLLLERALVANVQRSNMTPIEEGRAFLRLRKEFGMTIAQISDNIGRSRPYIAGRLLLMDLEPEIQVLIEQGFLPHDTNAVNALMTIPAGATRVKFASALAQRTPGIKIVIKACQNWLFTKSAERTSGSTTRVGKDFQSPGVQIATEKFPIKLPMWDVWKQLGALPPWSAVRDAATNTCDACALRPIASDANCRDCALVDCLRRMLISSQKAPAHVNR